MRQDTSLSGVSPLSATGTKKRFGNNEDKLKSFLKQKTGNLLPSPSGRELPIDAGDSHLLRASFNNARELRFSQRLEKIKADGALKNYMGTLDMFDGGNSVDKKIAFESLDSIDVLEKPGQTFEEFVETSKEKIGYTKTYNIRKLSIESVKYYSPISCKNLVVDQPSNKIRTSDPGHI
jgi:hypothetical protein